VAEKIKYGITHKFRQMIRKKAPLFEIQRGVLLSFMYLTGVFLKIVDSKKKTCNNVVRIPVTFPVSLPEIISKKGQALLWCEIEKQLPFMM
jgi:hypothetical protein